MQKTKDIITLNMGQPKTFDQLSKIALKKQELIRWLLYGVGPISEEDGHRRKLPFGDMQKADTSGLGNLLSHAAAAPFGRFLRFKVPRVDRILQCEESLLEEALPELRVSSPFRARLDRQVKHDEEPHGLVLAWRGEAASQGARAKGATVLRVIQ